MFKAIARLLRRERREAEEQRNAAERRQAERNLGLPNADRVAARALVLTAVAGRGVLETDDDKARAESGLRNMCDWLDHLQIADEIEPSEISVIHTAIGELDRQRTLNAVWRREGMGVLTWALGCTKLPRYDEGTSYGVVARQLGFLQARERTVLAFPLLRDLKKIMEGNETYFTLGWRLGEFASSRRPIDFAKSIEPSKRNSMTLTGIDIVDGDLAIGEDRIDRVSKDRYEQTRSIVLERHKAFNWLLGFAPLYSEVGTYPTVFS